MNETKQNKEETKMTENIQNKEETKMNETKQNETTTKPHVMLNRRCLIRTYSAGVHVGDIVYVNPETSTEIQLKNAIRIWQWSGGGLSLSAIANNGMKGGRINRTGEVYLTNVIEIIPTTQIAEKTYEKYIED